MRLESDHLVISLKQKLGHCHPCLLDWSVLHLVLRAWSSSGETVTPGRMPLVTWCTRCSWRTGARGERGACIPGTSNFAVRLILVVLWSPSSLFTEGSCMLLSSIPCSPSGVLTRFKHPHRPTWQQMHVYPFIRADDGEKLSKEKIVRFKSPLSNNIY